MASPRKAGNVQTRSTQRESYIEGLQKDMSASQYQALRKRTPAIEGSTCSYTGLITAPTLTAVLASKHSGMCPSVTGGVPAHHTGPPAVAGHACHPRPHLPQPPALTPGHSDSHWRVSPLNSRPPRLWGWALSYLRRVTAAGGAAAEAAGAWSCADLCRCRSGRPPWGRAGWGCGNRSAGTAASVGLPTTAALWPGTCAHGASPPLQPTRPRARCHGSQARSGARCTPLLRQPPPAPYCHNGPGRAWRRASPRSAPAVQAARGWAKAHQERRPITKTATACSYSSLLARTQAGIGIQPSCSACCAIA